jgi:transcriptional regulator of acetoin/glycerol metabolism
VRLPPLRERIGDVPALFQKIFAVENAGVGPSLTADFVEQLCLYDWPFNVRELVLLARRLRVLCDPQTSLRASDLPARMRGEARLGSGSVPAPALDVEGKLGSDESPGLQGLLSALRACQGNVAQAAAALGITRQRAYRLMQGYAVDLDAVRREAQQGGES